MDHRSCLTSPLTETPAKAKQEAFSVQQAAAIVDLIIDNAFVQVGDRVFRQAQGIPMGVNSACYFANYYLFMYELDFMPRLQSQKDHNPTALQARYAFKVSDTAAG